MMKHLYLRIGLLTALSLHLVAVTSVSCAATLPQTQAASGTSTANSVNLVSQKFTGQEHSPTVNPAGGSSVDGKTWMRGENIPWSTPVLVRDSQKGDYLAVFDRNYSTGLEGKQGRQIGEISNWSRHYISIYGYGLYRSCVVLVFVPVCDTKHPIFPVSTATLKIGSQMFQLEGENSLFAVDDELAYALRNAYPKQVLLRLTLSGGGETTTKVIGAPTVKAWQVIYQDAGQPMAQTGEPVTSPPGTTITTGGSSLATLPVVNGDTWRTNEHLPWSTPVLVKDEFEGDYVAVFDRDYSKNEWNANESGLVSNWSRKHIWLHIYEVASGSAYSTFGVNAVDIKAGDRLFHVLSQNNRLEVTDELAQALHDAGAGKVAVSFVNREGKTISHQIGDKTISAWKTIY